MKELNLSSTIRRKNKYQTYHKGQHIYPNLVQQNFKVEEPNIIWCMDFTYLFLRDGRTIYNCTIIDLYNREVVANSNAYKIDTNLATTAMSKAITQRYPKPGLIIHTDQESQFTSQQFSKYCKERKIQQSMSKAGCPYDNAVMEQYFNSLKHECSNHYLFESKTMMDFILGTYAFDWYNTQRPHTFNGGLPPASIT